MTRIEAIDLMKMNLEKSSLQAHSIAVGIVMKELAIRLEQDSEIWEVAGILHDVDYDQTYDQPEMHGLLAMEILANYELDDDLLHAIRAHGENEEIVSKFDLALYAADAVTGLITAATLMRPDRSIKTMKLSSLKKKFKNRKFAAGANRDQMIRSSELGLEISDFLELSMNAMAKIEIELGLG